MRYQLRDYTIREGAMDEFVREFHEGIVPLRKQYGFDVVGSWIVEGESRFVWIVGYAGPGTYEEQDAVYYASPERSALDPSPARHIEEMRLAMMKDA